MAYCVINFKTKKALKEAVTSGEKIYLVANGVEKLSTNRDEYVEGPHYPEPHKWYAVVTLKNGIAVKVR